MWKIWANYLLPMALKSCPKLKKIAQSGHTAQSLKPFAKMYLQRLGVSIHSYLLPSSSKLGCYLSNAMQYKITFNLPIPTPHFRSKIFDPGLNEAISKYF